MKQLALLLLCVGVMELTTVNGGGIDGIGGGGGGGGMVVDHISRQNINGHEVEVTTMGSIASVVYLDALNTSIKKLKCEKNKIILIGKDNLIGKNWTEGQIIIGGPKWECFLNSVVPQQKAIYGVIVHVSFASHHRVNVFIKETSPLNLFENTTISIRLWPSKRKQLSPNYLNTNGNDSLTSYNAGIFHNRLSARPFHLTKLRGSDDIVQTPDDNNNNNNSSEEDMDLSMKVSVCETTSSIAFDMKLTIAQDPEGISHVESFYNQANVSFNSVVESEMTIFAETGVITSINEPTQDPQHFLTVPVTDLPDLPPIVLQINVLPVSALHLNIMAAPGTTSQVTAKVKSVTDYSTVLQYNRGEVSKKQVKINDWQLTNETQVEAQVEQDMKMATQFSHQLKFTAHLGLDLEELFPIEVFPIEMSSSLDVELHSKGAGLVRSTEVISKLSASLTTSIDPQPANSTEPDFNNNNKEELTKGEETLFQLRSAECHGNKTETDQSLTMTDVCAATYSRNNKMKKNFDDLSVLHGDDIVFMSELTNGNWCHQQGRQCPGCFGQSLTRSKPIPCPDRMVAPILAQKLSKLLLVSKLTWPNRKLIVLKAWSEGESSSHRPSPQTPVGTNKDTWIYNQGRAIQIGISKPIKDNNSSNNNKNNMISLDKRTGTLEILGKLALCSHFSYVRQVKAGGYLEMATVTEEEDEKSDSSSEVDNDEEVLAKKMFVASMKTTSSNVAMCGDLLTKQFSLGSTFPSNATVDQVCGPADIFIDRTNTKDYSSLYLYPFDDIEFAVEGRSDNWCGNPLRHCRDDCNVGKRGEPWTWCSRRVMRPRLASRLRELSRLVDSLLREKKVTQKTPAIKVLKGHVEATEHDSRFDHPNPLYREGRGLQLITTTKELNLTELSLLAVCASFDYVSYSNHSFIEVFVKKQAGFVANEVDFISQSLLVVQPPFSQSREYAYPRNLPSEPRPSMLFDGSNPLTNLSPNFKIQDFLFSGVRYFRLDLQLLMCLERVKQTFPQKFHIVANGAYRSSTANLVNLRHRHTEEIHRFQAGKAVELVTEDNNPTIFLLLAKTVVRQCSASLRVMEWALGIGLHSDYIYVDLRAQVDESFIKIWNVGGDNETFKWLKIFSDATQTGGSLIVPSNEEETCKTSPVLGEHLHYLSLHLDHNHFCIPDADQKMCEATKSDREEQSKDFINRLISAAGVSALHTSDIIRDVNKCLIDNCGGCPGSGNIWLQKTKACSQLLQTFFKKASNPSPKLHNTVAFYSSINTHSEVHHLACEQSNVCVEAIPLYAVIAPLLDSKYNVEDGGTVKELLFGEDNPSPLMELFEQEVAMRASGTATVFIEKDNDIDVLRDVLKILMVYNNKIDNVELYLSNNVSEEKTSSSLRRKLDVWRSSVCPRFSRVAVTPFSITKIPAVKLRRSAEKSKPRNDLKMSAENWELDWLNSL